MTKAEREAEAMPKSQRRLQMADIARLAGVSTATVSRALSNSPLVSQETRTRILELSSSLRYSVNVAAKNLRMKQNRTVGVVIPFEHSTRQHLSDPFLLAMLGSLADALTERGYDMLFSRIATDEFESASAPFDTGRVIGMILVGQWGYHQELNQMAARNVPLVVWGAHLSNQLYCCVGSNNVQGGSLATEHLLARGCRRIAFFGDITLPEPRQRYEGYCNALTRHGIRLDSQLQVSVSFLAEGGVQAIDELARRGIGYDAIFACSDLLAMTAIDALRARGVDVPADVPVVGYDDIAQAALFHPRLSTVSQPLDVASKAMVDSLLALVDGRVAPSIELPTELIIRASSAI